MAVEVGEDFGVGDRASDGCAFFVDEDRGGSHDIAAGAGRVCGLDGVAGGAGDAFILEGAFLRHALREVAGEERDGVVAAFAMARELHALLIDEHVDVLEVPGSAEAIGVNGLTPLVVGLLVAVAAVFGRVEASRVEELAVGGHGVRGKKGGFFAEGVVVAEGYGVVELGGGAGDMNVAV